MQKCNKHKVGLSIGIPITACGASLIIAGISLLTSFSDGGTGAALTCVGIFSLAGGIIMITELASGAKKPSNDKGKKEEELKCLAENEKDKGADEYNKDAYNKKEAENFETLQNEYGENAYGSDMFRIPVTPAINNINSKSKDMEIGILSDNFLQ